METREILKARYRYCIRGRGRYPQARGCRENMLLGSYLWTFGTWHTAARRQLDDTILTRAPGLVTPYCLATALQLPPF